MVRVDSRNKPNRLNDNSSNDSQNSSQSVRPKQNQFSMVRSSPRRRRSSHRLSFSELGITVESRPSSKEGSRPHYSQGVPRASQEAPHASIEVSQASAVEGASQSSLPELGGSIHLAQVHHPENAECMDAHAQKKRKKDSSSSPPTTPKSGIPTTNRFSALASVEHDGPKSDHPPLKKSAASKIIHRDTKANVLKPSLLRPPATRTQESKRHAKASKPSNV